jgi:predicted O-methyltransferase YrrM
VALGSGPSTVWLGYALQGRLIAIDHDLDRAAATRDLLHEHGLTGVEVRHAPKVPLQVEGKPIYWYEAAALDDLQDVGLLVIDGTLAPSGPDALTPALQVLGSRLADGAAVVVDEVPTRVAPRQGGGSGLTVQRRLPGRWTVLTHPTAPVPAA